MSNILQTLFNTNHDQPSFLVFVILALIAIVVPNLTKYLYESRRANGISTKTASTTSAAKPRHQHKKKKR